MYTYINVIMPHCGEIKTMPNHVNNHHIKEFHKHSNIIYDYSQIVPFMDDSSIAQNRKPIETTQ